MASLVRAKHLAKCQLGRQLISRRGMAKYAEIDSQAALTYDKLKLMALFASVPICGYITWRNLEVMEEAPAPVPAPDPAHEHFMTAWIRKHVMADIEKDYAIRNNNLRVNHQKMMAHIEKKKIPEYGQMPTYQQVFGKAKFDFGEPMLPNSVDD